MSKPIVPPAAIPPDSITLSETIPGGAKWTHVIGRGSALRLAAPDGSLGVSALFYNADDFSERYNAADTVKIQFNAFVSAGSLLYSDMGRALVAIVADTCGHHDIFAGPSTPATNTARYGPQCYYRNGRDNLVLGLAKWGMNERDLMPCINFFADVRVDAAGGLVFTPNAGKPGVYLDLLATMNVLVVLSNTPHVLDPSTAYAPKPLTLTLWQPPKQCSQVCRNAGREAQRAFANTDGYFIR
ncbi:MAG: DUF1989 domain-containing protein [Phycisphaerales bacterium]|nr:DUF1989 domain-containing protein [Phycisphaerales bacterium]